jgi:predicted RNase H-like nuclease (RuvC/YqgF family)
MRILGIDPGGTTGWAELDWATGGVLLGSCEKWYGLDSLICTAHTVVVETFRLYPGMGKRLMWNDFIASQVIGAVKVLCDQNEVALVEENAATGKRIKLAKGISGNDHSRDALRHALSYALRSGIPLFPEAEKCIGGK